MSINFEAANMAGYNNPEIQIINVGTSEIRITHGDIARLISSGVIPILCMGTPNYPQLFYLSLITNDRIEFVNFCFTSTAENAELTVTSVQFVNGATKPVYHTVRVAPPSGI